MRLGALCEAEIIEAIARGLALDLNAPRHFFYHASS
jgi:hypothetical protein